MTEDYKDYRLKGTLHAPFSPILMEFQIPQPYIDLLNKYGDKTKYYQMIGEIKELYTYDDNIKESCVLFFKPQKYVF